MRVAGAVQVQMAKKFASRGDVLDKATNAFTTGAQLPAYPACDVYLSCSAYLERYTCAVCPMYAAAAGPTS